MTDIAARNRNVRLKETLSARRIEMQAEVHGRIQEGRIDRIHEARDMVDASDADIQGDLDMALLQMQGETLVRIEEALARLGAGEYGTCMECAGEITERRLKALPFAVRCTSCEERRERGNARHTATQRDSGPLFRDTSA